ncbi:MAG: hypothetical protein M0R06_15330 [Sphaerochaeta sp.]|jgi:hypothetical protein|nr:hypothetical protein [Sphaerochaeta sp.]
MWQGILGWLAQRILRRMMKKGIKEANASGKRYFTWDRSRAWRGWMVEQVRCVRAWANAHSDPALTADDDFFACVAWTLESDRLAGDFNRNKPASKRIDAHTIGEMRPVPHE